MSPRNAQAPQAPQAPQAAPQALQAPVDLPALRVPCSTERAEKTGCFPPKFAETSTDTKSRVMMSLSLMLSSQSHLSLNLADSIRVGKFNKPPKPPKLRELALAALATLATVALRLTCSTRGV